MTTNEVQNNREDRGRIAIFINDEQHFAPSSSMTGAEIKKLGGVPPGNHLFLEQPGPDPDRQIADDEVVELRSGFKFYDLARAIRGDTTIPERIQKDIERLRQDFPKLTVTKQADGNFAILVDEVSLASRWEPSVSPVLLVVPSTFPQAVPTFFVSPEIKHRETKQSPKGANGTSIDGRNWVTFCYSQKPWEPARENLWRFVKHVQRRFHEQD